MKQLAVLASVIGLGLCSCERHTWKSDKPQSSDTINLFPTHGDHAEHKGDHPETEHKEGEKH